MPVPGRLRRSLGNRYVPRDDALLRRFKVLTFTYGEKILEEKAVEFESAVKPRLGKLKAIGDYVASRVVGSGLPENPEDVVKILEEAYREAGLEVPEWLGLRHEEVEDFAQDQREAVRVFLVGRVNEEFSRFVGKVLVEKPEGMEAVGRAEADMRMRLEVVLDKQLIPWLLRKGDTVYITRGIVKELEKVVGDIGGLKSLAELLGWGYDQKSIRLGKKVVNNYFIIVDLEELVGFLSPDLGVEGAEPGTGEEGAGSEPGTEDTGS